MRRLLIALAIAAAPLAASAATLGIPLDQSIRVGLPAPAHDVIVGNPAIAAVEISDQRHLVVTGKSAGVTNIIVTNMAGRTIFSREVVVSAASGNQVALINGGTVVSYACAPTCAQVASEAGAPFTPAAGPSPGFAAPPPPAAGAIQASPNLP